MKRRLLHKCLVKHFGTVCAIEEKIITILNSCFKICSEFNNNYLGQGDKKGHKNSGKCTLNSPSVSKSNHQNQNSNEFKTLPYPSNEEIPWSFLLSCIFPTASQLPVMPKLGLFHPSGPFLLHSHSPSLSCMASTKQGAFLFSSGSIRQQKFPTNFSESVVPTSMFSSYINQKGKLGLGNQGLLLHCELTVKESKTRNYWINLSTEKNASWKKVRQCLPMVRATELQNSVLSQWLASLSLRTFRAVQQPHQQS